jgi:hypothetical protein
MSDGIGGRVEREVSVVADVRVRSGDVVDVGDEFDLAFSFAGVDRGYVERTKMACDRLGLRVMYDRDMRNRWWGANFVTEQRKVYGGRALFFVPFISVDYFRRTIPSDEFATAAWTDAQCGGGYMLPVIIGDVRVPAHLLPPYVGCLRAEDYTEDDLACEMFQKVERGRSRWTSTSEDDPAGFC